MKWDRAINKIETLMAQGKEVEIQYHRKWARNVNEFKFGNVEYVGTYEWHGETLKFVRMSMVSIEEGNFIIDAVNAWYDHKNQ